MDPVTEGAAFGSGDEVRLLEQYFMLPRPPDASAPFRAPWSSRAPWQNRRYGGTGLQKIRSVESGRGRVLIQTKVAGSAPDNWRLTPNAGSELISGSSRPIKAARIIDLAVWFGRDVDVDDLDASVTSDLTDDDAPLTRLIAWFQNEFDLNVADLVGTIYSEEIPDEYLHVPFEVAPIGEDTFVELGSLPPAPTVESTREELIAAAEAWMSEHGYELTEGLVGRVLSGWLRGDLVVLLGQPGTGKSLFASLLAQALESLVNVPPAITVGVRADFDEAEFLGYERLDGSPELRRFAKEVLTSEEPLEAKVVILEEFNLASIETYLSSVLVATQLPDRRIQLPGGEHSRLPVDTFVIATCNSYRDEPETRTRVSSPTKRRSTIITMPNVLADRFDAAPDSAVSEIVDRIISTERQRISKRIDATQAAQFDGMRTYGLATIEGSADFSESVRERLNDVCAAILKTPPGRSWFTMGLLKDVTLTIGYADRNEAAELRALGEAVADKLVHQLRGTHSDVEELREVCADLPNAAEIAGLIDRMMDGPSDELLPLL
ncbi:AAA family ATPase [Mycolicibacterium sp. J2]|uniref:AAA family ATPase n=1 Tax=Mycolicibacterium sp. J2 TaxID=2993511 RepID=UPI00224A6166|nr:AAA family ATPase [Mycolicibacterium sp. J2]MCX2714128.1 AAA family ATPase [Mycolicibacterium sp. J2]